MDDPETEGYNLARTLVLIAGEGAEAVDRQRLAGLAAEARTTLRELPQDAPARQVEAILCGVLDEIERLSEGETAHGLIMLREPS